jgi:hypothetical protein
MGSRGLLIHRLGPECVVEDRNAEVLRILPAKGYWFAENVPHVDVQNIGIFETPNLCQTRVGLDPWKLMHTNDAICLAKGLAMKIICVHG